MPMAGMGPVPKDPSKRARPNATFAMTWLPAEGRKGRAPAWPLDADLATETAIHDLKRAIAGLQDDLNWATTAKDRAAHRRKLERANKALAEKQAMKAFLARNEKKLWAALWKLPQATQWEKRGWYREVAMFVRHQVKGEGGSLQDSAEARQREDRLGLNDQSMLRLRWAIAEPTVKATAATRAAAKKKSASGARARRGHLQGLPSLQSE